MNIEELDRLHREVTPIKLAASAAVLWGAWPAISARLKKAEKWRDSSDCWACGGTAVGCKVCGETGLVSIFDRDAAMKRQGAAEWLEAHVKSAKANFPALWLTVGLTIGEMETEAARLRAEGENNGTA